MPYFILSATVMVTLIVLLLGWQAPVATPAIGWWFWLICCFSSFVQPFQFDFPLRGRHGHNRERVHGSVVCQFLRQTLVDHAMPGDGSGNGIKARRDHHHFEMCFRVFGTATVYGRHSSRWVMSTKNRKKDEFHRLGDKQENLFHFELAFQACSGVRLFRDFRLTHTLCLCDSLIIWRYSGRNESVSFFSIVVWTILCFVLCMTDCIVPTNLRPSNGENIPSWASD